MRKYQKMIYGFVFSHRNSSHYGILPASVTIPYLGSTVLSSTLAITALISSWQEKSHCEEGMSSLPAVANSAPGFREGLPVYRRSEVAAHKTAANRIWVTYKDGKRDIYLS